MSMQHPSLDINVWGRSAWFWIHAVSFAYAERPSAADREKMRLFLESFAHAIPCPHCQAHFLQMTSGARADASHPALSSRDAFTRSVVDWHNQVNAKLKKPIVPYERVYGWFREDKPVSRIRCSTKDLIILALLAALAYQFKRQKHRASD